MKLKDLLSNREKLRKHDELKEWKEKFSCKDVRFANEHSEQKSISDNLYWYWWRNTECIPDHIKQIIVDALEAEIAKLDEE